jgi:inosose dehydratase
MGIRFGIAPINWSNDDDQSLGASISLDQCLKEMVEAGFSGCELGHKFPKEMRELKACLESYNLALCSDWIGTRLTEEGHYEASIDHFKQRALFLRELGVKALKVCECGHSIQQSPLPIFHTRVEFNPQQWSMLLSGLHEMGAFAREHGQYVAYQQHLGTGVERQEDLERLMANTDPDLVSLLPDTGHLFAAKMEPADIFHRYQERILYVHLKDVRREKLIEAKMLRYSFMDAVRNGLFTVPSDGCIDFVPILNELKEHDFDGWLIVEAEQDPAQANPSIYAQKARDMLRQFWGF